MTTVDVRRNADMTRSQWIGLGLVAAVVAVVAVLVVQVLAMRIWPEIALFRPLDSLPRTVLFTAVPALLATAVLAWMARRQDDPVPAFIRVSAAVLALSIIPDYLLPVEHKTFLASTVTAFMHVVAALVIVSILVAGYRRQAGG